MNEPVVPVGRPLLPSADVIARYLSRLDQSRRYTNHGELVGMLEARLTALFGVPTARTITAASGTAALTAAILAIAGRATASRPLCLCPAHTFVATALAAEQCGYRVHFVDVDERTWALDAGTLGRHALLDRAGVVVAVAPYGRRRRDRQHSAEAGRRRFSGIAPRYSTIGDACITFCLRMILSENRFPFFGIMR